MIKNPVQNANLFKYPLGQVYQLFGENPELYSKPPLYLKGHNGADIFSYQGCPILSTKGIVVETFNEPTGYGKHIRILTEPDKNGNLFELVYGHCDWIKVNKGDLVEDNQQIAGMSNTGYVISGGSPYWGNAPAGKGVHLHFGVRPARLTKEREFEGEKFYPVFGKPIYFPFYTNGYAGYVNPLEHIEVDATMANYALGLIKSMLMKLKELSVKVGIKN